MPAALTGAEGVENGAHVFTRAQLKTVETLAVIVAFSKARAVAWTDSASLDPVGRLIAGRALCIYKWTG